MVIIMIKKMDKLYNAPKNQMQLPNRE